MMRTLSAALAALTLPLGQLIQGGGSENEDPRVLQKLDAILAKLEEIAKLLRTEVNRRAEIRPKGPPQTF